MNKLTVTLLFLFTGLSVLTAQIAEIPFELKNGIILLDVYVNDDSEARTFVFDTGATYDVLDTQTAEEMGLESNYSQQATGAGGRQSYDIILNQKLRLNDAIQVDNTNLLLTDLTRLKEKFERDFAGIIGYSLLNKYITSIDYEEQKLLLHDKAEKIDTSGYKAIPFEFHRGITIPQFDISIQLRNGESFSGRILFDSGAAYTLIVNTPYNKKNKLTKKAGKTQIIESQNLVSKSISETMAIESMNIGGFELDEMVILAANDKSGVSSYKNYLGILGAKIISRFNLILDYSNSTLYLKPNKYFEDAFEFPLSGITFRKEVEKIVIHRVQEDSPAYTNGIRKGDQLVSINDISGGTIDEYRELLKKEGQMCKMVLLTAEGSTKEVTIKLERLL